MYVHPDTRKYLIRQRVKIGINEDLKEYICSGFVLENNFYVNIENKSKISRLTNYDKLKGLSLISIEEKKDEYIRFIFEKDTFIEIDMSEDGYEGPEALQIGNQEMRYLDVIRGDE